MEGPTAFGVDACLVNRPRRLRQVLESILATDPTVPANVNSPLPIRLLILSDLHLEIWGSRAPHIDVSASHPDAVILAGDIDKGANAIAWADRTFPDLPVLYVHGNHEGYGEKLDSVRLELEKACAATGHIHFLDSRELIIGGVRFLGATLWTDFRLRGDEDRPFAMLAAEARMNDYRMIRLAKDGYRTLRASDTARWHQEQKSWLAHKLSEPFSGKTVVITHMAPSARSIPERYVGNPLPSAFASNLDEVAVQADLWVHGHIHGSMDYHIGKCRVVANPCGYPRNNAPENPDFAPEFIVMLD